MFCGIVVQLVLLAAECELGGHCKERQGCNDSESFVVVCPALQQVPYFQQEGRLPDEPADSGFGSLAFLEQAVYENGIFILQAIIGKCGLIGDGRMVFFSL